MFSSYVLIFSLVLKDTVSCLAHALGAMNYSDRCILRLHDVVVTRKVGRSDPSILAVSTCFKYVHYIYIYHFI